MRTLETVLVHSGYTHTQVHRDGLLAIYSGKKANHVNPHHWEVVRIQVKPAFTINGRDIPEREVYPPPESWGTHGWTAMSLSDAYKKFDEWASASICTPPPSVAGRVDASEGGSDAS